MRLDICLLDRSLAKSRTEAKSLIIDGKVTVNGKIITKPSYDVTNECSVEADRSHLLFVSRGGFKLLGALNSFSISPSDRLCIDIGASSGGFTDCLLKNGAKAVISIDSGTMQLDESLRCNSRVISMENTNARYLKQSDLPFIPDLAVMDVSFISATAIIPTVYEILSENADFICLIKPQFEVGKSGLGKGGIVKNEKLIASAIDKVTDFAVCTGFVFVNKIESPIKGGDGNTEYLAHFKKGCKK